MASIITGSKGFIAKKLIEKLQLADVDLLPLSRDDGNLAICSLSNLIKQESKIEIVFHLAARTFVPRAWDYPEEFMRENIASTLNILNYCRLNKTPLLYMSAYIYGKQTILPISEESPINPSNPYAQSKIICEQMCKYYAEVFSLDITILRPFNVYGPHQDKNFLIPEIIAQIKNKKKIYVNSLKPKRDFINVEDLIDAIIRSSRLIKGFQIYNIGSGSSLSVQNIIELIEELIGKPLEYEERGLERNAEMMDVVADISAAKSSLSWRPKINFREGLKQILIEEGLCT